MKKYFYWGLALFLLTVVSAVNVSVVSVESEDVVFSNLEAVAGTEWNHWTKWLSQGLTKDEREIEQQCPTEQYSGGSGHGSLGYHGYNASGGGSGFSYQQNPESRTDIRCADGEENCSPINC